LFREIFYIVLLKIKGLLAALKNSNKCFLASKHQDFVGNFSVLKTSLALEVRIRAIATPVSHTKQV